MARLAPQVLGTETLHQKSRRPPSRFRVRVGDAAKVAPPVEWRERDIVRGRFRLDAHVDRRVVWQIERRVRVESAVAVGGVDVDGHTVILA